MDYSTLASFRPGLYQCFERAPDALMNATDALLSQASARSFAELSLSPLFPRRWCSLYDAFKDGRINRSKMRELSVFHAPAVSKGKRLILGVDSGPVLRPESETLMDRTYQKIHNLPKCRSAVAGGWSFSTLVQLPETPGSWTWILDNLRIPSNKTPSQVAAEQLADIVPLCSQRPVLVADRYYGSAEFIGSIASVPCDGLIRIQRHRIFFRDAPQRTGKRGAPKKDGDRFKCNDPSTHGPPDEERRGLDAKGRLLEVSVWKGLHFKKCRQVFLWIVRITRHGAVDTKRDPKVSWFIWMGQEPPLSDLPGIYKLRFSLEHGYRFDKQNLLWTDPRFRTPDRFQVWTDIVAAAHNQLVLASTLGAKLLYPWESKDRNVTPQQVRRAMGRILLELGTPACMPQPRGKSPGWPKGRLRQRQKPHPVIKKTAKSSNGKPNPVV